VEISCGFPPGPHVVDHIVEAERLGYERAWLFDSPALYSDIWVIAALAAQRTSRIALGPAVLVPNLRHPLAQASAIATLEQLAPGRVAVAIGTGFTGRMAMGHTALTWAYTRRYIEQLRALLRGEKVEVDGAIAQMLHGPDFAPPFPIETPIVVAANGPKGMAVARDLGDGVMTIGSGEPEFDWCSVLAFGTVLDAGESAGSERAFAAAGPGLTVVYHAMYEGDPASVDALPNGVEWRKQLEEVPEAERHLAIHKEHMVSVTERDRPLLDGDLLKAFTWTGEAAEVRARIDALAAAGATELLYAPMGPDVSRELRTFMEMATA
jgi:5,10-methylenetetrahydromethanopterin reductase